MNIAIDFDDTFTADPDMWKLFIRSAYENGHNVFVVTWRSEGERFEVDLEVPANFIMAKHFTARKAKRKYMEDKGIYIDIWIDDNPAAILYDMPTFKTSDYYPASNVWS